MVNVFTEPVEKSSVCASEEIDDLISEISSHCQQLEVRNKPETASDSNTVLSSHEKSKEKCLGCYPFNRFPFFVLNSRNCSAALRKDEHTCEFHRNMINNKAKLESRIFGSSLSKSSAVQLSPEISELKHFETESFKQRGSFSEQSSSKSRNASRQNVIHPRQVRCCAKAFVIPCLCSLILLLNACIVTPSPCLPVFLYHISFYIFIFLLRRYVVPFTRFLCTLH